MEQEHGSGCRVCRREFDESAAAWEILFEICMNCTIDRCFQLVGDCKVPKRGECMLCKRDLTTVEFPSWLRDHFVCLDCLSDIETIFTAVPSYVARSGNA